MLNHLGFFFFFLLFFSKVRVGAKEGGSHYWEMAVAITCGYGGYLLPLLAAHSSCQLDPGEQTSVKLYSEFSLFHSRKCIWKCCLENVSHFVLASVCQQGCSCHSVRQLEMLLKFFSCYGYNKICHFNSFGHEWNCDMFNVAFSRMKIFEILFKLCHTS